MGNGLKLVLYVLYSIIVFPFIISFFYVRRKGESKMKKALIIVLIIMCIIVLSILIAPMFLISFG